MRPAEARVVGSWETVQQYALISDLTRMNLVIKDDLTTQRIPAKILDGKRAPVIAHWSIEKEGNDYYLELTREDGMSGPKLIYHLHEGYLVQDGTSVKYLQLDDC